MESTRIAARFSIAHTLWSVTSVTPECGGNRESKTTLLMLMFPFPMVVVVVRMMPSEFESTRCGSYREEPPSGENGEDQGQSSDIHKPSPTTETSSTANQLAVTRITGGRRPHTA
ncbi:MAG TPA: hypothetical protein VMH04_16680 [Candidatus Solibacter sp.]|nr:hypothetical protein [Candidatus Solibacter sp.]